MVNLVSFTPINHKLSFEYDILPRRKSSWFDYYRYYGERFDISNITHVVNFEMPEMPELYMHRIGRTSVVQMQLELQSYSLVKKSSK
jgi:hypothetical protein